MTLPKQTENVTKFQRLSRLGFVTAPTSLNGRQPNFARCLAVSCAGILCSIYISGVVRRFLPPDGLLPTAKSTLRPNRAFYIDTRALGVSQTMWRSAKRATYIRQGGHHVGHRPTFYLRRQVNRNVTNVINSKLMLNCVVTICFAKIVKCKTLRTLAEFGLEVWA